MHARKQDRNIIIQITKNFQDIDVDLSKLKKLVKTICSRFASCQTPDTTYEIGIAIVDNAEIRKINKKFLNRSSATDVISFDLSDNQTHASKSFELVVNGQRAVEEANLRGHSGQAELALYIAHGLLHHFGFDDSNKAQAKKMHETEDEILKQLGFGLVYNEDR